MTVDVDALTDSIISALGAALPATTAVGDGKAPSAGTFPYVTVYSGISNAERGLSLSGGEALIDCVYQFTCVGKTRKSREITAKLVRDAVLDETTALGGPTVRVSNRRFIVSSIDDDPDDHTFAEQVRISMWAAPV